jgi:hypothetical protein
MKKEKLTLQLLKVQSFKTGFKKAEIKGGNSGLAGGLCTAYDCSLQSLCNLCQGTEEASNCCSPIK